MTSLRPEELWVTDVVARALGARVTQHDDQSAESMYDLDILHSDGRAAAMEVTAAADGESIALWNLLNGSHERWIEPCIAGGWMVSLLPSARAKALRSHLPAFLRRLEEAGVRELRGDDRPSADSIVRDARALGIAHALQSGTDFPGSIYATIELGTDRTGGFVSDSGDALPRWFDDFLAAPARKDVLAKLAASGATERHVFVIFPGFAIADFAVTDLLMRDHAPVPQLAPSLPTEVTHVWAMSTWASGSGFRWCPSDSWLRFDKLNAG